MDLTEIFDTKVSIDQYLEAGWQTLYMVGISLFLGTIDGVTLGIILALAHPQGMYPNRVLFRITDFLVNTVRWCRLPSS